ncbi:MAG TPA: ATP-binding protein [Terriglobales bacterium]|nr:ATP-binding protein [Terriglobales bacterium]
MSNGRIMKRLLSISWQLKAVLPVVAVLLLGLVTFQVVLLTLEIPNGRWILTVAAAGAVAICGVLLAVLVILVERPLRELKTTIERVRSGDLSARVNFARRNDDIGELGHQFNQMVEQLETNQHEIERLHEREMARAEHLATIGELAAGLAHEIRNPLAGIAGVVEVIGKELPEESTSVAVLPEVMDEIKHIQLILNDLLAYAKPRSPVFRNADLRESVEQAVILAKQQVRTRPIAISFEVPAKPIDVYHDPAQIQQVVLNLLLNAIQAIANEGRVEVRLERKGGQAGILVEDTGRGISQEALGKIFKPFFTTRREGTGLGLSLAKGVVDAHEGRIEVKSEIGKGSEFCVLLPIDESAAKNARSGS